MLIAALVVIVTSVVPIAAPGAAGGSGAPVLIGFLNQERGAVSFPEYGAGARAARNYINSKLDGINGRQLRFVECSTDGSPEASIDCANRFVEAKVTAVLMGIDIGSEAAMPILTAARIPFLGHHAIGPAQAVSRNAFFFGAAIQAYMAGPMKVMSQRLRVKSLVFITLDSASARSLIETGLAPAAKHLNVKLETILYRPSNADYTQIVTTALAARPDAIFFTSSEPDCLSLLVAARQLRFGGHIFTSGCVGFIKTNPEAAEGVFTTDDVWPRSAAASAPNARVKLAEVKLFAARMKKDAPQHAAAGAAQRTFAVTMDLAIVLRRIRGPISSASLLKQIGQARNVPGFMGQPFTCDGKQWPGQPSACAGGILQFRVQRGARRLFSNGYIYPKDVVTP